MTSPRVTSPTVLVPPAGVYRLDPRRCAVTFRTRHLFGLAPVRGSFEIADGQFHVADPVWDSWGRVTIPAASFRTANPMRDATIRSDRYLAADRHRDITFASTRLDHADGHWVLHGSLSVRGATRPIEVSVHDVRTHGSQLRLHVSAHIDRYEFGIGMALRMTGRDLHLRFDLVADSVLPADAES